MAAGVESTLQSAAPQVAERLYYSSAELEFPAVVTDIRLVATELVEGGREQVWQVALDRTAFYPESGGQPWDTGVLVATARSGAVLEVPVERVEEDEATGEVWHFVRKPLVEGTEVLGRVDFARRTDHEQQHSGQHLLSAMFLRELGARTVSFHLGSGKGGADSSTIDLALADGMERLSADDLARVEEAANRVVFEGRPLLTHFVEREFAEIMLARGDLRKLPERPGRMRLVQMQGIEFNACGGTHVANTGAIGAITIRRVEKVRQGWRVEFCCGLRAVRAARQAYAVLGEAAGALSVGTSDVPGRVRALLEDAKRGAKQEGKLLGELATAEANSLDAAAAPGALIEALYKGRDVGFAMQVARSLQAAGRGAVLGAESGEAGGVVFAKPPGSTLHAGNIAREICTGGEMRGGGSADIAQILCSAALVSEVRERVLAIMKTAVP